MMKHQRLRTNLPIVALDDVDDADVHVLPARRLSAVHGERTSASGQSPLLQSDRSIICRVTLGAVNQDSVEIHVNVFVVVYPQVWIL